VPFADAMLVPLPDGIDPVAAASVADNVSDGYRHVAPYLPELLERDPETEMVIVAGMRPRSMFSASVGLYAGLAARALGARSVVFADCRPGVRAQARRLGFDAIHPAELRRRPTSPLTVDASADPRGLRLALSRTAPDGVCSSAGTLHRTMRLPTGTMYARNATLRIARAHVRTLIPSVLELMASGRLHPETVTTTVGPIDRAPEILRRYVLGDDTKTILEA
jgi:alcohol dehydrogenase